MFWHSVLVWSVSLAYAELECKNLNYMNCVKGKYFKDHVYDTLNVTAPGLEPCQDKCFQKNKCVSYNVGPLKDKVAMCELNAADHWIRPSFLVSREGFTYCPIENPCSSSPCPSNRICTPNFQRATYSCDDGGWSNWGSWKVECTPVLCPTVRKRSCTNPPPRFDGTICPGPSQELINCSVTTNTTGCYGSLGMENTTIKDDQISASSFYHVSHDPYMARLNNQYKSGVTTGSWSAKVGTVDQWLQIDLLNETIITKVATQGRPSLAQWVTKYALSFSNDNVVWSDKCCIKTYNGNSDQNTIVTNILENPIKARYVRLIVKGFYGWPSMRMELYGCTP